MQCPGGSATAPHWCADMKVVMIIHQQQQHEQQQHRRPIISEP
jgi:hypothetical protein